MEIAQITQIAIFPRSTSGSGHGSGNPPLIGSGSWRTTPLTHKTLDTDNLITSPSGAVDIFENRISNTNTNSSFTLKEGKYYFTHTFPGYITSDTNRDLFWRLVNSDDLNVILWMSDFNKAQRSFWEGNEIEGFNDGYLFLNAPTSMFLQARVSSDTRWELFIPETEGTMLVTLTFIKLD